MSRLFQLSSRNRYWLVGTAFVIVPLIMFSNTATLQIMGYYTAQIIWTMCDSIIHRTT